MNGLLPSFLMPLTVPASWVYGSVIAARNRKYDRGRGVHAVDRPVISVGNITMGGTGKTPMVMWLAEQLISHGHHPVIAMRGYASEAGEAGDEQAEYAERLPGVPVVAHPDRAAALRSFLDRRSETDCVLLDDGFQHRRLKRDFDLVLSDATAGTLCDRLLPAGNLREPVSNLRRADAVVVTHADHVDRALSEAIERWHGRPPIAWSRHVWPRLLIFQRGSMGQPADVDFLRGKPVLAMLGVAKPEALIGQLERHGARVMVHVRARDHERYDRAKLTVARGLCDGCDAMVVTAKDWVKIRNLIDVSSPKGPAAWPVPIVVPQLAIDVFDGADALRERMLRTVERT